MVNELKLKLQMISSWEKKKKIQALSLDGEQKVSKFSIRHQTTALHLL